MQKYNIIKMTFSTMLATSFYPLYINKRITPSGYYYKQKLFFKIIEKLMYLVYHTSQIHLVYREAVIFLSIH
jgi:hypothetical protein